MQQQYRRSLTGKPQMNGAIGDSKVLALDQWLASVSPGVRESIAV
jgi:hypothetical protein